GALIVVGGGLLTATAAATMGRVHVGAPSSWPTPRPWRRSPRSIAGVQEPVIRAAGGVVVDEGGRVALVHRPRHGDWSLPKGKLDPGEDWEAAALREIEEECGLRCALEDELPASDYRIGGRRKRVRWWRMRVLEDLGTEHTDDEVDELRWATPAEAQELLSYAADRRLVTVALR
ncbi:MAG: hypothetical protein JWM71_1650, partial [Solirubrobacteraceae bacterium]|nr:hypothetical protein [Solirubrobacteraceae bacterium]